MASTPLDRALERAMHLLKDSGHPRLFTAWWQDLVTAAASAWLVAGLVVGVWARAADRPESFLTWWHLVCYTGVAATAAWVAYLPVRAHRADGRTGLSAVPHGYGPAVAGIALLALSGLAGVVWHAVFGTDRALDLLFTPTNLGLAVGGVLLVAAPWLSAWRRDALGAAPEAIAPHLRFAAPALSLGHMLAAPVLFASYAVAFSWRPAEVVEGLREPDAALGWAVAASIMFTTVLLLAVVIVATRRFRLPFGCFTVAFAAPALMAGANAGFANGAFVIVFLAAGVLADALTWLVRPELRRRKDLVTFAAAWAVPTWLAYLITARVVAGAWPDVAITTGAPLAAALVGAAFMLVIQPERRETEPPRPAEPSPFDEVIARAKAMTAGRADT